MTGIVQSRVKTLSFFVLSFTFLLAGLATLQQTSFAEEITIFYTGDTHAMLYPCNCPVEPDGGIARRAALVRQLRKKDPDLLLLDCGGFFAGGLRDENTQNIDLDKQRTSVNLRTMALMEYDAAAIGADEFNFGHGFLAENIGKTDFPFLSCDVEAAFLRPYIVKEIKGVSIGIIGLTGARAVEKSGDLKIASSLPALEKAVSELKNKGTDIIILLSSAGEEESIILAQKVSGIDILMLGSGRQKEEPSSKLGDLLVLWPSRQGRRLGKIMLKVESGKITDYQVEALRLSDNIKDEPDVLKQLPVCFSDRNCKKEGFLGACSKPGTADAQCVFTESKKIQVLVITPRACKVCNPENVVTSLKKQLPGLTASYLYYPDAKADKLIQELDIKFLPAYLFTKDVESQKGFIELRKNLQEQNDYYILAPQASGFSYFLGRERIAGQLDLFISLYDKQSASILEQVKHLQPKVHFQAIKKGDWFDTAYGNLEVEEYLRCVCVNKYYADKFWDYITCRAKNSVSSWWEDCAGDFNIEKIKICARQTEGVKLLEENIGLNKQLKIMFGPTYLWENQEIFSSRGALKKEELEKIIKR